MGKISKNDGFKTPEGYFDGLSEKILDKLGSESSGIPKSGGFKVPEGYFDTLDKEIMAKVRSEETKVIRLRPYRKYLYTAASVAAVILIVIGLQWQGNQTLTFEDLANMELEEYFDDYAPGLSSYEIAEVFQIEDLEVNDILEDGWDDENIVEYLDDTIEDIDELNLDSDE